MLQAFLPLLSLGSTKPFSKNSLLRKVCNFVEKIIHLDESFFLRFLTEKTSQKTDVYYIDSTFLEVCKNQRIYRHKTFKEFAARGVSSCGWFYGFKLHLITNHLGEIVSFSITKGNISDQNMTAELAKKN